MYFLRVSKEYDEKTGEMFSTISPVFNNLLAYF